MKKMTVNLGGKAVEAEVMNFTTMDEPWSVYRLEDGTTFKMKLVVANVLKRPTTDPLTGLPQVQVMSLPGSHRTHLYPKGRCIKVLVVRTWQPRNSQMRMGLSGYAFLLGMASNLSMTPVSVSTTKSDVLEPEHSEWVYPEQEVKRILVDLFKDIPQVKSICARFGSEGITIWTLLESYDRDARDKVYEKELEVCRMLHIYDFDFRATSIDLVSPEELVRTGSHQIYSRQ